MPEPAPRRVTVQRILPVFAAVIGIAAVVAFTYKRPAQEAASPAPPAPKAAAEVTHPAPPAPPAAPPPPARKSLGSLGPRIVALEDTIELKRIELAIPGVAYAVIIDGEVAIERGFGHADIAANIEVTPDTLFSVGSTIKPMTALLLLMAMEEGRLALDDRPQKHLPAFKIADPDTDQRATLADLLSHRTGVDRVDLPFVVGPGLSRDQLVAGIAKLKPVAKLGERFLYQNLMFVAAGEAVARAENATFEQLMRRRLLDPLGMKSATLEQARFTAARGRALGYRTAEGKSSPEQPIATDAIAPAGGLHASVRDMARFARLILNGGVHDGRRLVAEATLQKMFEPRIAMSAAAHYGLGWVLLERAGQPTAEHDGNLPGYHAHIALMRSQRAGVIVLTNVSVSPLPELIVDTFLAEIAPKAPPRPVPKDAAPGAPPPAEAIIGGYIQPSAAKDITITKVDGKLWLSVPGQPRYPMEDAGDGRYKLGSPLPKGFFVTFRAARNAARGYEIYAEQPHGSYVLPQRDGAPPQGAPKPLASLIGVYQATNGQERMEIAFSGGEVALIANGQPAYPLIDNGKETLELKGLPSPSFAMRVKRDAGRVTGFVLEQPQGRVEFSNVVAGEARISVEELNRRVLEAAGGKARLEAVRSIVADFEVVVEGQGTSAKGKLYRRAPAALATELVFFAFGQQAGRQRMAYDGEQGGVSLNGGPMQRFAPRRLAQLRASSLIATDIDWRRDLKSVAVRERQRHGGEEWIVVDKVSREDVSFTDYYSAETFLLVRRDMPEWHEAAGADVPTSMLFKGYRREDGIMISTEQVLVDAGAHPMSIRLTEVRIDAEIPVDAFAIK